MKIISSLILLAMAAAHCSAAVIVENNQNVQRTGGGASADLVISNFAVTDVSNRILLVAVGGESVNTQGVTFNGNSLTALPDAGAAVEAQSVSFYYMLNPEATTGDIVADIGGFSGALAQAFLLSNALQIEPAFTDAFAAGASEGTVTLSNLPSGSFALSIAATQSNASTLTSVSGVTDTIDVNYDGSGSNDIGTAFAVTNSTGDASFTWTRSGADDLAIGAVGIQQIPEPGTLTLSMLGALLALTFGRCRQRRG